MHRPAWTALAALVVALSSSRAAAQPASAAGLQASWFPLYDRNPQSFVESLLRARAEDFRPAVLTVHRSRRHPSRVTFQSPDRGPVP